MFKDRKEAGAKLANKLLSYKNNSDTIVIALPRGGVVVAFEIAQKLNLPLDIVASRKISMPDNPEAAIGAVTPDGNKVLDQVFISEAGIEQDYIDHEIAKEIDEGKRRTNLYRNKRNPLNVKNKTVIVVDDGVATGLTMKAAIQSIKAQNPKKIILAIPIAPSEFLKEIAPKVDQIICLEMPSYFIAVGTAYKHFDQTEDNEVIQLILKSKQLN